jgi:hypothetical protein
MISRGSGIDSLVPTDTFTVSVPKKSAQRSGFLGEGGKSKPGGTWRQEAVAGGPAKNNHCSGDRLAAFYSNRCLGDWLAGYFPMRRVRRMSIIPLDSYAFRIRKERSPQVDFFLAVPGKD